MNKWLKHWINKVHLYFIFWNWSDNEIDFEFEKDNKISNQSMTEVLGTQGTTMGTQPAFTCSKLTTETLEQGVFKINS